jgi:drug/metabolite transporter (DMT)-like permease
MALWTTIAAVIICVIIPDILLLYALQQSPMKYTSVVLALVHIAPIFTVMTVYLLYKQMPNMYCLLGIALVIIGVMIIIMNSATA